MLMSYVWGQKEYRIPYAWKKLTAYIVISVLLYGAHQLLIRLLPSTFFYYASASIILAGFILFILRIEKAEFQKLPLIGKYLGSNVA
jgi:hypothetical protein